ncbi:MAG TPA: T3SS effector HopA1 family protein [Longimicrobium sp.]|nr:T3SS effector HopA1 family protein [Longimicrobium sp.]
MGTSALAVHPDLEVLWPRVSTSGEEVRLDGRPLPFDRDELPRSLQEVAWELYLHWYTRTDDLDGFDVAQDEYDHLLRRLGEGRDRWERGWAVALELDDGTVLVEKDARRQWVRPGGYVLRNPHGQAGAGARVDLFLPGCDDRLQEGFVHFFGATLSDSDPSLDLLRVYLSHPPGRMVAILPALLATLDRHHLPYRLKVLRRVADYRRADTAVLYVEDRYAPLALRLAAGVAGAAGRPSPRLVAVLRPGIGIAEDPSGGTSFGMDRCYSIATGLSQLLGRPDAAPGEVAGAVLAALRADGVDPARPWYTRGSHRAAAAYRAYLGFPDALLPG